MDIATAMDMIKPTFESAQSNPSFILTLLQSFKGKKRQAKDGYLSFPLFKGLLALGRSNISNSDTKPK